VWQDSPVGHDVDPELLRRASVFSTCSPDQLTRMVSVAEVTEHPAGDVLTQAGVIGHRFHLILDGGASVERGGATVATVPKGEFIGEIGLLGGGPATATVRCTEPTRCLTIRRERFWEVLEAEPAIALRILEVLCRRLSRDFRQGAAANLSSD
jgi:CRP-like cAMP-binding protein